MIKLISSQSDWPLPDRLCETPPLPASDRGAMRSIERTHDALRKLLVLIETQPHKLRPSPRTDRAANETSHAWQRRIRIPNIVIPPEDFEHFGSTRD